jgi:hypothetical protein
VPADWSQIEALVKPWFDQGLTPDRNDLVDLAYKENVDDDIVDALDTLGSRPVPSLEALKEQLQANNALS